MTFASVDDMKTALEFIFYGMAVVGMASLIFITFYVLQTTFWLAQKKPKISPLDMSERWRAGGK